MKRPSLQNQLLAPLYVSFLMLVLLIIVQGYFSFTLEVLYRQEFAIIAHSLQVERETEHLLSSTLDEQTSIRGYLLTRDKSFLKPFQRAESDFYTSFYRLHALVSQAAKQRLNQLRKIHDRWHDQFILKVLNGTANPTSLPGKVLFDPMREIVQELRQQEDLVLAKHTRQLQQIGVAKTSLDIFSIVTAVIAVIWNLLFLRRRVELPLRRLTLAGQSWRSGDLNVRLDYTSADEMGRLAVILDQMARELGNRQRLTEVRNQQLQDLISALSHDLRTPLLATRNTLRPMLQGAFGPINESWADILKEFQQSNEDLIKLVEVLLDVSRYEARGSQNLSHEPLDWSKIINQASQQIMAVAQQRPILAVKIAPSLPLTYGDPIELQRVVQNLLDNAVRVSKPEQSISVEVLALEPDQVRIAIRDHGPGIASQDKERLFHRFIQGRGRRGGLGMGLYLCRQIVEAHHGTINVESQLDQGSTFWFTLPAIRKP
jgi:signal transduction histidine kinase